MRTLSRSLVVGICAVALMSQPAAAAVEPPASLSPRASVAASAARDTTVRFLRFDHVRGYGSAAAVRGQVATTVNGQPRALTGVRVKLYRKVNGTTRWQYLKATRTSTSDTPRFRFRVRAVANAQYRATFSGNAKYRPSRAATKLFVFRHFDANLEDGSGRFHGRVTPDYSHRRVHLQKRSCARCGWHGVKSEKTGRRGHYSFKVGAPRHGRWFWRVSTAATTKYIRSYSGVFTTRLR